MNYRQKRELWWRQFWFMIAVLILLALLFGNN
jgi:hypothetical protein